MALSSIAGAVNAAGFFVVGTYTSHVTGNVARFGDEFAQANWEPAYHALRWVLFFFLGAVAATAFVSAARYLGRSRFAVALLAEAAILAWFTVLAMQNARPDPGVLVYMTELLCFAMGLQNALVTNISGAVVRTTHLTGVTTDLGIETVNVAIRFRQKVRAKGLPAAISEIPAAALRKELHRTWLLVCIFASFLAGAVVGPRQFLIWGPRSMIVPIAALVALSVFDIFRGAGSKWAAFNGAKENSQPG